MWPCRARNCDFPDIQTGNDKFSYLLELGSGEAGAFFLKRSYDKEIDVVLRSSAAYHSKERIPECTLPSTRLIVLHD